MIFFSAHGVPLAYVEEAGDPYKAEMEECVDLIMEELEKRRITNAYTLAYQVLTSEPCFRSMQKNFELGCFAEKWNPISLEGLLQYS